MHICMQDCTSKLYKEERYKVRVGVVDKYFSESAQSIGCEIFFTALNQEFII